MSALRRFPEGGGAEPLGRPKDARSRWDDDDDAMVSVSLLEPAETGVRIDGRAYRVQTWTWAQWKRIPQDDRPCDAWRQGTVWMRIVPS